MADKEVKIDFQTTANTKGAKEVVKETDKVTEALDRQEKGSRDAAEAADRQSKEATQGARETEEAIERVVDDAQRLREEFDRTDGLDPKVRQEVNKVAESMDRAADAGKKLATAKDSVRKSSRNSGLAVLEFSRAIEDAQYGIRGVLNNIPGLVTMLGGGAGLAGAISLAAVGLTQLYERLFKVDEKAVETTDDFQELVDSMAALKEEANEVNYGKFLTSLDAAKDKLDLQNERLSANIRLLTLQRQAANQVANAQDELAKTEIAIRQATDEGFTAKDAAIELAQLELNKLARDQAEQEAKIQDEIQKARQKVLDAQKQQTLEVERSIALQEKQVELEERIADLKSKQAARGALESQITSRREIAQGIFRNTMDVPAPGTDYQAFQAENEQAMFRQMTELARLPAAAEIQAEIQASQSELKKTESRIQNAKARIGELRSSVEILDVQAQSVREQGEVTLETVNQITELQQRNIARQTELQVSLKGATTMFQDSVIPALEQEVARSGATLDDFGRRTLEGIRDMANNQTADLQEKDRLIAALKVLQTQGIDQTGQILTIVEGETTKRIALEQRIRTLETQINSRR